MPEIVKSRSVPISRNDGSTEADQVSESYQEDVSPQEFGEDKAVARPKRTKEHDKLISLDELNELINRYQDDSPAKELKKDKDIPTPIAQDSDQQALQTTPELENEREILRGNQLTAEDSVVSYTEINKLTDLNQDELFPLELGNEDNVSFFDLTNSEREFLQITAELNFVITESKRYQFTRYVQEFYKSIGEDEKVALINTEIFYLWCMMVTIFDFSIDSDFRRKLIKFFNSRIINLYLKWKESTISDTTRKVPIDFNNLTYYSNQLRANRIHLNSSYQNTESEILFGKIVFAKILENIGNRKIDLDRKTILMPVQAYYELKQRVIEILNDSTDTICF